MIGRRGFITGLVAVVAAPAIVRASAMRTQYDREVLSCVHFDLRGIIDVNFRSCQMERCSFTTDAGTALVSITLCLLVDTDMAGLRTMPQNLLHLSGNVALVQHPFRLRQCEESTS